MLEEAAAGAAATRRRQPAIREGSFIFCVLLCMVMFMGLNRLIW